MKTIFVSDHWKDISSTFFSKNRVILPNIIWVPDELARKFQKNNLLQLGVPQNEIEQRLFIFGHPGIDNTIKNFRNISELEIHNIRRKYNCDSSVIFMPLDPFEEATKEELGFDWKSSLEAAVNYLNANKPEASLLVKAHPRQKSENIQNFVDKFDNSKIKVVKNENIEPLIATADEIWGMSSLILIVAIKLEKPIKVFVPNITELGRRHLNSYINAFIETT